MHDSQNGDWLKRAAGAKGGIFGNSAVEAMYPLTAAGERILVGMYDGKTQFLIDNPIHRYLINSPMLPG
jgi:hypothetical protein